jgi:hypothetical protein
MKVSSLFLGAALILATAACHSSQVRIPGEPLGPNERLTGVASAHSTGFMLFQVIPINQNERFRRALQNATMQAGGTRLTDVVISERWFWTPVGNGFSFHVQGAGVTNK